MLNYVLGTDVLKPFPNSTYYSAYDVRSSSQIIIESQQSKIVDTGIIFTHGYNEKLDITLHSSTDEDLILQKFSTTDNINSSSTKSENNKTLKLDLKNDGSGTITINRGDFLCVVVSVSDKTSNKILISVIEAQPTQTELEYLDITSKGVAQSNKALILNNTLDITGINIFESDYLGINKNAPDAQLHIKQLANTTTSGIRIEEAGSSSYWGMYSSSSNSLQIHYDDTSFGYVGLTEGNVMMNFTGQHRCFTNNQNINENVENYIGMIVSTTGSYKNLNNMELTVNDALPEVELSNSINDKKVFGVISSREDPDTQRSFQVGAFGTYINKDQGDERLFINSVGEGMVWVCDKNGNMSNGDLITTSELAGYGQLQDDDIMRNYTFGKITQNCDFSEPDRYIDNSGNIVEKDVYMLNPDNYFKCKLVGCVYYCG